MRQREWEINPTFRPGQCSACPSHTTVVFDILPATEKSVRPLAFSPILGYLRLVPHTKRKKNQTPRPRHGSLNDTCSSGQKTRPDVMIHHGLFVARIHGRSVAVIRYLPWICFGIDSCPTIDWALETLRHHRFPRPSPRVGIPARHSSDFF